MGCRLSPKLIDRFDLDSCCLQVRGIHTADTCQAVRRKTNDRNTQPRKRTADQGDAKKRLRDMFRDMGDN